MSKSCCCIRNSLLLALLCNSMVSVCWSGCLRSLRCRRKDYEVLFGLCLQTYMGSWIWHSMATRPLLSPGWMTWSKPTPASQWSGGREETKLLTSPSMRMKTIMKSYHCTVRYIHLSPVLTWEQQRIHILGLIQHIIMTSTLFVLMKDVSPFKTTLLVVWTKEPLELYKRYTFTLHTRPDKEPCNLKFINNSESTYGNIQAFFTEGCESKIKLILRPHLTSPWGCTRWNQC